MRNEKVVREKIKQVNRLNRAMQKKYEDATRMSPVLSDMPKGGGSGDKMANDVVEMVTVKDEYNTAKEELTEMKEQLSRKMIKLDKWQHVAVIRKRYIEEKSITEIMDEIGYEESQTKRLLKAAEEIINKIA